MKYLSWQFYSKVYPHVNIMDHFGSHCQIFLTVERHLSLAFFFFFLLVLCFAPLFKWKVLRWMLIHFICSYVSSEFLISCIFRRNSYYKLNWQLNQASSSSLLVCRGFRRGKLPGAICLGVLRNIRHIPSRKSGILRAYTIGFNKELAPTSAASVILIWKKDLKLRAFVFRLNTINGSHVSNDASVTQSNVAVSFLSLLIAPWRWGLELRRTFIKIEI